MAQFTVTTIIDGDTFTVRPNWKSGDKVGDTVRPIGYDAPEKGQVGYQEATDKLTRLIYGKVVELGKAVNFDHGRIFVLST